MLDLARLKDSIDVETVITALDIHYKTKGTKFWLLCPFHDDKNIGSAFIGSNGRFHCFSCNKDGDIFDVVMAANRCSFGEAAAFLASLFGGIEFFELNDRETHLERSYKKYRLSSEELNALRIPKEINLRPLYVYDEKMFEDFIAKRSNEMIKKYNYILKNFCSRDGKDAYKLYELFGEDTSSYMYSELKTETLRRICICQDIIKRFA